MISFQYFFVSYLFFQLKNPFFIKYILIIFSTPPTPPSSSPNPLHSGLTSFRSLIRKEQDSKKQQQNMTKYKYNKLKRKLLYLNLATVT